MVTLHVSYKYIGKEYIDDIKDISNSALLEEIRNSRGATISMHLVYEVIPTPRSEGLATIHTSQFLDYIHKTYSVTTSFIS
jgi:hypothetical protein